MARAASPTAAATPIAAGVKTPATGAFSDPTHVGTMIQSMYPQYRNMDAATLGQRWIDVHTPAPSTGSGVGTGSGDILSGPTDSLGTTPGISTNPNQNTPDLSGLSRFATPIQQPKKQTPVKIAPAVGMGQLTGGNQLASQPQQNSPWIGQQIVSGLQNFFKAPNLQAASKPPGY